MTKFILLLILVVILLLIIIPKYKNPVVIKNFINNEECDEIIKLATPRLKTSTVSTNRNIDTSVRKSDTAWIRYKESPVVDSIMHRCLDMVGKGIDNCESLQIVKYEPGGFYKPHQDILNDEKNNPRVYTFILCLNDDYDGGETNFPNLNKKYKLTKGDLLHFNTLNIWNMETKFALHGGEPVNKGEKWICNLWVHKYPRV